MEISRELNLVLPLERAAGTIYVHSTPISRAVFKAYWLVMSKAFSRIYSEGLSIAVGPRISAMMLQEVATTMGVWEGPEGVRAGLVGEMVRLSNVVMPGSAGWTTVPLETALNDKLLTEDEADEVQNAITFFTLASRLNKKTHLPVVLDGMRGLWITATTLSNSTEFAASLPTSTGTASSGAKAAGLSVPS